jgi:hypothetical protein
MPKLAWMLIGLIVTTACIEPTRSPKTTTISSTAPIHESTTSSTPIIGPIRGALPDGTIYDIAFPTPRAETIDQIQAELIVEVGGRDLPLEVDFRPGRASDAPTDLVLPAGGWSVAIDIPDWLDDGTHEVIGDAIEVSTEVDMPVLTLRPPLRWSKPTQVRYDNFTVRSGCPNEAAACNPTHAVSVVPGPGVTLDTPISIQSYALRPKSDPNYLPPGPLSGRWSPDVVWTGDDMVVWGGSVDPGQPTLTDGAAFDPGTDQWRMMSSPPLSGQQATRAVWAGQEMVVLGEETTAAWGPRGDSWRVIAGGIIPPLDPGMTVATGSEIITWTPEGLYRLPAGRDWESMPDPALGEPGLGGSVLRIVGSQLVAIGQDDCERLVTRWEGGRWSEPLRIALGAPGTSCGRPNQTAVLDDVLVMWDDTSGEVISVDPESGETTEEPLFPLSAMEHASGPLALDDGFLVTAGLEAAVFQAGEGRWATSELPGLGTDVDMLWTGDEVLMWAKCCYGPDDIDAWRWAPPMRGALE